MATLFSTRDLRGYLQHRIDHALSTIERMSEDELLGRSDDDIVSEAIKAARCEPLHVDASEWVNFQISEFEESGPGWFTGMPRTMKRERVYAEVVWSGTRTLFECDGPVHFTVPLEADITDGGTLRVSAQLPGEAGQGWQDETVKKPLNQAIDRIVQTATAINNFVDQHNRRLDGEFRPAVEQRRRRIQQRRELSGRLGFPVTRRASAPRAVPLERRILGTKRRQAHKAGAQEPYQDEYAIEKADYEEVMDVIAGMLRAFERTPSVAASTEEEFLRDILLITLNGTFQGQATGETFVKTGKTDILVRLEDRHVFVGECKWWDGPASITKALDQLLGYLPWRDEKAALVVFIDRVNASAVLGAAVQAVRDHASYKRDGAATADPSSRQNFVLGHPGDPDREIHLGVLFAVIHKAD